MRLRVGVRARVASAPLRSLDPSLVPPRWLGSLGRVVRLGSFYRGHLYVALPIKHAWKVGPTCASLAWAFLSLPALQSQVRSCKRGIGWVGPRGRVNYGVVNELGCLIRAGLAAGRQLPSCVHYSRTAYVWQLTRLRRLSGVLPSSSFYVCVGFNVVEARCKLRPRPAAVLLDSLCCTAIVS